MNEPNNTQLIKPHGGVLVDNFLSEQEANSAKKSTVSSLKLNRKQLCDLELLMNGGFSPLQGFLNEDDYLSVCKEMRLSTGELWPMPITLDVTSDFAQNLKVGDSIALENQEGLTLAILQIESKYTPDKTQEALDVFGATDTAHPGVFSLFSSNNVYLGGKVLAIELPMHYDFLHLRQTPTELRKYFKEKDISKVVAFQTRNPMHKAHVEITKLAAQESDAHLLVNPSVGMTKPGDVDYYTRVKVYEKILDKYERPVSLSLLPLAMRMGGPREALWHAIIRKNYGCSHFIVGRDHAGPGKDSLGNDFYGPYEAQELVAKYENELGITMVPFQMMVFVPNEDNSDKDNTEVDVDGKYVQINKVPEDVTFWNISGTELRQKLNAGEELPAWFTYPEVAEQLRETYPIKNKQGLTIFFTGLSGAGKSTIANALLCKLLENTKRSITLLDGDLVRNNLSSELGFSKEDRDLNIKRISFVASEITKHKGVALCAPIAPYQHMREVARNMVEEYGNFVLVYISTPLEVCENRDTKGLYAKARSGELKEFTGISDPYETPIDADVVVNTVDTTVNEEVEKILAYLRQKNLV